MHVENERKFLLIDGAPNRTDLEVLTTRQLNISQTYLQCEIGSRRVRP